MRKKEIKWLAFKSFTRGVLDPKKVKQISQNMIRKQLREYVKYLKYYEAKNKIIIEVPDMKKADMPSLKRVAKLYPGRRVEILENPSLILGLRVTNDDLIYDYNLKNNLENIIEQIEVKA